MTARAGQTPGKDAHSHHDKCAKACLECLGQCEADFHHCIKSVAGGKKEYATALALCVDCSDLCAATAKLCSRSGPLAPTACESCAKACESCATECEKFASDEPMRACAQSCRDCATACRQLIKHAGHGTDKK